MHLALPISFQAIISFFPFFSPLDFSFFFFFIEHHKNLFNWGLSYLLLSAWNLHAHLYATSQNGLFWSPNLKELHLFQKLSSAIALGSYFHNLPFLQS